MSGAPGGEDDPSTRPDVTRGSEEPDDVGQGSKDWVEPPESDAEEGDVAAPTATTEPVGQDDSISVPRKFRDAKEGRDPKTVYRGEDTQESMKNRKRQLEDEFGEKPREIDFVDAVLSVGSSEENYEQLLQELKQMGYGMDIQ